MAVQIQFRRDTEAQWSAENPLLAQGELGLEFDTGRFKIGDGIDLYNDLPYASGPPGVEFRGAWDDSTAYDVRDVVLFEASGEDNPSLFIAIAASTDEEPPAPAAAPSAFWDLFLPGGADGQPVDFDDLSDVSVAGAQAGEVLVFNGAEWVADEVADPTEAAITFAIALGG